MNEETRGYKGFIVWQKAIDWVAGSGSVGAGIGIGIKPIEAALKG